jgi:hypothetical protein
MYRYGVRNRGVILILLGILAYGLALPGMSLQGIKFDAHTLLFGRQTSS